jgi:hypothetical protein
MYNDVQRFLGLVQYQAHYMPDVSAYTTPLAGCVRNNCPFEWTPLLAKCLQNIKALACKVLILRPVDPKNLDPIWLLRSVPKHLYPSQVPELRLRNSLGFPHLFLSLVPEPRLRNSLSFPSTPSLPLLPIYIPHHHPVPSSHAIPISPDVASLRSCYLIIPFCDSDSSYHI